jgi:hypothetical protein
VKQLKLFDDIEELEDGTVFADVSFVVSFDKKEMPTAYTDILYLEDEIKDALINAMHDIGATKTDDIIINIEGLE